MILTNNLLNRGRQTEEEPEVGKTLARMYRKRSKPENEKWQVVCSPLVCSWLYRRKLYNHHEQVIYIKVEQHIYIRLSSFTESRGLLQQLRPILEIVHQIKYNIVYCCFIFWLAGARGAGKQNTVLGKDK